MSSRIRRKLLLDLLLTQAKTKTLRQKIKTQQNQNLHSVVRCKLRNLSRGRFNLIFKKHVLKVTGTA